VTFKSKKEALAHFEATKRMYLNQARATAVVLLKRKKTITVDDVRKVCPPPENVDPRIMGAIFNTQLFESCGFVNSVRKACHHRPIRKFRLS